MDQRPPKARPSLNFKDAANTPLPPSSPYLSSPRNTINRSASSLSLDRRSSSPALNHKSSRSSLRNAESPVSSPKLSQRRSSSNLMSGYLPVAPEEPQLPPLTPTIIANHYFAQELALHADSSPQQPRTLVLIHDSCYGHRFSRPKTKQADLNLIVERPERVRAGVMGISAAYVRLGERHAGGRHMPHPKKLPEQHFPFRIQKTSRSVPLTSAPVVAVHGIELAKEIQIMCESAGNKLATTAHEVERDDPSKRSFHTGDLYLCQESLDALQGALGGVCDAVDSVFQAVKTSQGPSRAFVCIRPPGHHCSADFPSGFCWLNNVHVGIQHAIQQHGLTHAAIIDFDLHHGDGSQEITWAHNENMFYPQKPAPLSKRPFIGYYSLHDINSFPCEMGDREKVQNASLCIDNAHGQSIWNVHLKPWKTEQEFWQLYENKYLVLLEKARIFLRQQTEDRLKAKGNHKPKAAIFISAGFDASEFEGGGMQRHKVNVPTEFYARFTKDIVALAEEQGTSVDGRVISVLEGGYSNRALISGTLSHISGLCASDGDDNDEDALVNGMTSMGLSGLPAEPIHSNGIRIPNYQNEWWSVENLELLESVLDPTPIIPASNGPKKVRVATYSSPTQASIRKVVDPTKIHLGYRYPSASPSRPSSPPPPEVDWDVSACELAALLVPSERETRSCTASQLAEPKTQKDKPPIEANIALSTPLVTPNPAAVAGGRTLRDRKAKPASPTTDMKPITTRKSSIDRRRTIATSLPNNEDRNETNKEPRRRLSVASTVSTASTAVPNTKVVKGSGANGVDVKKTRVSGSAIPNKPAIQSMQPPPIPPQFHSAEAQAQAQLQGDPMDELTSSIKKITIKVPSNEEYASRQKKTATTTVGTTTTKPTVGRRTSSQTATKKVSVPKHNTTSRLTQPTIKKPTVLSGTKALKPPHAGTMVAQHQRQPIAKSNVKMEPVDSAIPRPVQSNNGVINVQSGMPPIANHAPEANEATWIQTTSGPLSLPNGHDPQTSYHQLQWVEPNSDLPNYNRNLPSNITAEVKSETPAEFTQELTAHISPVQQSRRPPIFNANGLIPFSPSKQQI